MYIHIHTYTYRVEVVAVSCRYCVAYSIHGIPYSIQCVALRCNMLQWVAVCCSELQPPRSLLESRCSLLHTRSLLEQCETECWRELQCVAVSCSVMQCMTEGSVVFRVRNAVLQEIWMCDQLHTVLHCTTLHHTVWIHDREGPEHLFSVLECVATAAFPTRFTAFPTQKSVLKWVAVCCSEL